MGEPALKLPSNLDEFLVWEERQPLRYEFVGGVVTAMAGGTADHNTVALSIWAALRARLGRRNCRAFVGDFKVVAPTGASMYPDVALVCPPPPGKATSTKTPTLVVEVLSKSTAGRDDGVKREDYYAIPSLEHYLLVSQDSPSVGLATREADGTWHSRTIEGLERSVDLPHLGLSLPMAEIFADVEFGPTRAA